MYLYDDFDRTLLAERVAEFRGQVARRLTGELNEDEFKSLRLMNGIYLQLHAYMLRIAIPYGTLASDQLRKLAYVARRYDRGYGHFTTRQNIQFHWIKLAELPDAMADLADAAAARDADQRATACATSLPTSGPALRPTRLRIRASGLNCCASTSPCIRNSHSCRGSSRLPLALPSTIAPHWRSTTSRYCGSIKQSAPARPVLKSRVGGGLGRTPFLTKIVKPFLAKA